MSERPTAANNAARIEKHEAVCAERYQRIDANLTALKEAHAAAAADHKEEIKGLKAVIARLIWFVLATLVACTGGAIGMIFALMTDHSARG